MILTNVELYWNDEYLSGPTTIGGTVRAESIQLTGVTGTPQYRLKSGDAWTNLDVDGLFYRFEVIKDADLYSLEITDDAGVSTISIADFEIKAYDAKCGRENFVDVVNYVQITQTQISFDTTYPYAEYKNGYVLIDSILEAIPLVGTLDKLWADLGSPFASYYSHVNVALEICDGPNFTLYQPSSGSSCDLTIFSPTISQPNKGQSDGSITINATSSGNITYSLDGGTFQSSNVFPGLPAAEYVVTIRDDTGNCNDVDQNIVLTEKYFRIAKLNAVEFKIPNTSERANFNNTLFYEMSFPNRVNHKSYCQVYFDNEVLPIQFQSNFVSHTITVIDFETGGSLANIVPVLVYDSPENFKYWEFTVDLSLYSDKVIQIRIIPSGETIGEGNVGVSEPLKIITEDIEGKYVKVQYSSNKNHSDIYWRSGFAPFLYVEGQVASTTPQINKEVSFDCQWNVNTQSRELKRQINFNVYDQPYFVFEKLIWGLGNGQGPGNFYLVNDVSINTEDAAYDEPDFPEKYSYASSSAKLQERDLFAGDLSTTPTPVETVNYLLVNPNNDGGLLVSPDDEITFV